MKSEQLADVCLDTAKSERVPTDLYNEIELDAMLEKLIESYCYIGTHESDPDRQRDAFQRMGELVAERSPGQVERMEREKRIRR
jgi:hypothetical protein